MTIGGVATAGAAVTHPPRSGAVTSAVTAIVRPEACHTFRFLLGEPLFARTGGQVRLPAPS